MSFNQAASCFAFAARIPETTSSVIRVFNSDPLSEKLRLSSSVVVLWQRPLVESQPINHGPSAAANPSNPSFLVYELLHRSNFIALVIASNPNSVVIWDCLKGRIVLEYREESRVLGVNWRCDRIIITLLTRVKVYTFSPSPVHLYTFATMTNDYALTSLSPVTSQTTNSVVLAFCGRNTGQVQYCTLTTGTLRPNHQPPSLSIIQAHNNPLRSITVSKSGKYIATASSTGTLIRVFDSATRSVLHEFRRGTENALIYCLKFCWDERFLIVGSDRGTAHIF
ncbi:WD40-repeat-containing domain protein, partial [Obelidium mucronatum]